MPDHNVILGSTYFAFHMLKQKYIPLRFFAIWLNGTFTLYYVRLVLVYIWETGISRDFFYSIPYVCILSITKYFFFFCKVPLDAKKYYYFSYRSVPIQNFNFAILLWFLLKDKELSTEKTDCFLILNRIHTYIHNWPFSQNYWPSFSHHLCCVC